MHKNICLARSDTNIWEQKCNTIIYFVIPLQCNHKIVEERVEYNLETFKLYLIFSFVEHKIRIENFYDSSLKNFRRFISSTCDIYWINNLWYFYIYTTTVSVYCLQEINPNSFKQCTFFFTRNVLISHYQLQDSRFTLRWFVFRGSVDLL